MLFFILVVLGGYCTLAYQYISQHDAFYPKFTHKASSLILGISRANRGVVPSILKEELNLQGQFLNFAFNGGLSPYGESYLRAIKRKVKDQPKQIFIVSVSVTSICDKVGRDGKRETNSPLSHLHFFNLSPNVEYLLKRPNNKQSLYHEWVEGKKDKLTLKIPHADGWTEAKLLKGKEIPPFNKQKLRRFLKEQKVSEKRIGYLQETIRFLLTKGEVFLVRLPIKQQMKRLEERIYPGFSKLIKSISQETGAPFLDFSDNEGNYLFHDNLHHLESASAKRFSKELAKKLLVRL